LLKEEQTAAYTVEIGAFQKVGRVPTGITQNVEELLSSVRSKYIFGTAI
jgi:hypothetical protein